jgi:exosortase/archaeosortase family protein
MTSLATTMGNWRWRRAYLRAPYAGRFATLLLVATAWYFLVGGRPEEYLRQFMETTVLWLVPLVGLHATTSGENVVAFWSTEGAFSYQIAAECAGLQMLLLLGAAVLAYPVPLSRRLAGLAAGLPLTVVANVIRLAMLALIGVHAPAWFTRIHDIGWPLFQIGGITLFTLLWLRWAGGGRDQSRPPHAISSRADRALALLVFAGLAMLLLTRVPTWYGSAIAAIVRLLVPGATSPVLAGDEQRLLFGLPRFLALTLAIPTVLWLNSGRRAVGRALRVGALVIALHICEGLIIAACAMAVFLAGGTPTRLPQDLVFWLILGVVVLVLLREVHRVRPALIRQARQSHAGAGHPPARRDSVAQRTTR